MSTTSPISELQRRVGHHTYDLVVIGAGINGTAIARDAALRGLRTLVVDKADIGSGTSCWSSRLIHGGLRYLEHFEVRLVRESLRERERLLRHAPHLVRPVGFLIPHYPHNARRPALIELGMIAYDLLSLDKALPHHRRLSSRDVLARCPGLDPTRIGGGVLYFDAQATFPERLCVENAVAATRAGARVATYTEASGPLEVHGNITTLPLRDTRTGAAVTATTRLVINAGGPWVDHVLTTLGASATTQLIGGTKGSHLVVNRFPGAPTDVVYYEARSDNRLILVMPWNGRLLIGTTDTHYDGNPDDARANDAEIDYLLAETNGLFPGVSLSTNDILYTYSGVRPLPYAEPGTPAGAISRDHHIVPHPGLPSLLSVVGGKLTTARALAEQTVATAFRLLGRRPPAAVTTTTPLPGGTSADWPRFEHEFLAHHCDRPRLARRLLGLYGTRAPEVIDLGQRRGLATILDEHVLAAEIAWAVEEEHARSLSDILLRRTMVGLEADLGLGIVDTVAALAADLLAWDAAETRQEIQKYRRACRQLRPQMTPPAPPLASTDTSGA